MDNKEIQSDIEQQKNHVNDEKSKVSKNLEKLKNQLQEAQKNLDQLTARQNELKTKADGFDRLNREKVAMNGAVVKSRYDGEQEVKESTQAGASLTDWLKAHLTDQQRENLAAALKVIDDNIASVRSQLNTATQEQTTADNELADKQKAAADAEKQYKEKVAKLQSYSKQLDDARNQVAKQRTAAKAAVDAQNAGDAFVASQELSRKQDDLNKLLAEVTDVELKKLSDEITALWNSSTLSIDVQASKENAEKKRTATTALNEQLNALQQKRDANVKDKVAEVLAVKVAPAAGEKDKPTTEDYTAKKS